MSQYSRRKELNRPYVIAELNTSHNGDLDVAKRMILAAKKAGADSVKFQSFSSNSLYSDKYFETDRISKRIFDKVGLSDKDLLEISEFCKINTIDFSSTAYSQSEIDFLVKNCNPAYIKIASMDINNYDFLKHISQIGLPVILSTGMSTYDEIYKAVRILSLNPEIDLTILHCTSNYPTNFEEANLRNIIRLKKMFPEFDIGYSDHTLGSVASVIASTIGAKVIEKHFTLDNSTIGMDNQMATEPSLFEEMVSLISVVNQILGSEKRIIESREKEMKNKMRRSIILKQDVNAGTILTNDMLDAKRPGYYIPVSEKENIVGKAIKVDLKKGDYIETSHLNDWEGKQWKI